MNGTAVKLDVRAALEVGEVADQAVAGHVGGRGRAGGEHRLGRLRG